MKTVIEMPNHWFVALFLLGGLVGCHKKRATMDKTHVVNRGEKSTIYHLTFTDIKGDPYDFSKLKGKRILIVNTASKCAFTPQYEKLEKLYERYRGDNFVVIGFPSDDFAHQEPGSNAEIERFCASRFGVRFPMMQKSSVKGANRNEVYRFLTEKSKNGVMDSQVQWNFQKYLIDTDGALAAVYFSAVEPDDERIVNWIEG